MNNFRKEIFINKDTGQVLSGKELEIQYLKSKNEALDRKQKGLDKRKKKEAFEECISTRLGAFNFTHYSETLKLMETEGAEVDSAFIFRFIYLTTFMDFDNVLRYGAKFRGKDKLIMEVKDLGEVMGLSRNHVTKFKQKLIDLKLISIDDETGTMTVNTKYCHKGKLKNSLKGSSIRVFEEGVKELYRASNSKEHKKLGLFIQLLPYLNVQHNVLCKNTEETNPAEIKPLTIQDICRVLGYNVKNARRIEKDLISITVGGKPLMMLHWHNFAYMYSINPRIFYKGNDIESLQSLINLFDIRVRG